MKNRDNIRCEGTRQRRILIRAGLIYSMSLFYCLVFAIDAKAFGSGVIVFAGLCVLIAVGFFKNHAARTLKRRRQISTEVMERYPKASARDLHAAFSRLRGHEMRMESLLYLFSAVGFAALLYLLYLLNAYPLSWIVGIWAVLPFLLLTAAALFLCSFPRELRYTEVPELEEFASNRAWRQIYAEKLERPDRRRDGTVDLYETKGTPDRAGVCEEYLMRNDPLYRNGGKHEKYPLWAIIIIALGCFLFFVCPNFFIVIGLILRQTRPGAEFIIFMGIIFAIPIDGGSLYWLFRKYLPKRRKINRVKKGGVEFEEDLALSAIRSDEKAYALEVCFSRAGTVLLHCTPEQYIKYDEKPVGRVCLLTAGGIMLAAAVAAEGTAAVKAQADARPAAEAGTPARTDAAQPDASSIPEQGKPAAAMLTDWQIRAEAMRRIETMDPAEKERLIGMIRESSRRINTWLSKGMDNLTYAEEEMRQLSIHRIIYYEGVDFNLRAVENIIMEEYGLTRQEIRDSKRNPLMPSVWKALLIAAVVGIGGNVAAALIAKNTGTDLSLLHVAVSSVSCLFAFRAAGCIINALRFRTLQRTYRNNPDYQESLIRSEIISALSEQYEQRK